jgi:hypothetical protein
MVALVLILQTMVLAETALGAVQGAFSSAQLMVHLRVAAVVVAVWTPVACNPVKVPVAKFRSRIHRW